MNFGIRLGLVLSAFCLLVGSRVSAQAENSAIEIRGVVEGFYGKPWSEAERLDQFSFYREQGLNTYIYAPKDDPYHREQWRQPYPAEKIKNLQHLIAGAEANNVDFVFALSPGLDMHFGGAEGERDVEALLAKFERLYDMGVRSFAVFFDDIENKDAPAQAAVLNEINRRFIHKKSEIRHFFTVPTEYFSADMKPDGIVSPYTRVFAAALDQDILVLYTGQGVVCEGITREDIEAIAAIYRRRMAVWWNYPVNDYRRGKLALGPIVGLEAGAEQFMAGFIMNPMEESRLSKISLATGADYAADPKHYDPDAAWGNAIQAQYKSLAPAMQEFADHSQRMENSWARTGRDDARQLRQRLDRYLSLFQREQDTDLTAALLRDDFMAMKKASSVLAAGLAPEVRAECSHQLQRFYALAVADETALAMLQARASGQKHASEYLRRKLMQRQEQLAADDIHLSEKTAKKFIAEALTLTAEKASRDEEKRNMGRTK